MLRTFGTHVPFAVPAAAASTIAADADANAAAKAEAELELEAETKANAEAKADAEAEAVPEADADVEMGPLLTRSIRCHTKIGMKAQKALLDTADEPDHATHEEIVQGTIVYIDVRTAGGEDASALFVEALLEMGARCVQQWTWNSAHRGSGGGGRAAPSLPSIAHVVFQNSSARTLDKVQRSERVVSCN
ncbi:MAG: hypothetical protein M1826_006680 [Phylliscum demangeonii]|nr:MAG: hypothetical protein M1826_006680 [Phylliscum demangeonii]